MKSKISSAVFIAVWLLSISAHGQEHRNSWFKSTLNIPVAEKFDVHIEFLHRRQNGFESENYLDKNLMHAVRTWVYYKQSEEIVYGISPFAYFSNYKIIQHENDAFKSPAGEYRFSAMIDLQHELAHKLFIADRSALEYRVFEGPNQNVLRLRSRLSLRYDFTSRFNMSIGDEIFVNPAGADAQHLYDHDRLFTNFSFIPRHNVKVEMGYIYISRLPKDNHDLLEESNLYLNFTYTLQKRKSHDMGHII